MKHRIQQMTRVAGMRALRERICEAESVRAAAQLRTAERSRDEAEAARVAATDEGRQAIVDGDRAAWVLADAMREVAGWNRAQLDTLCAARAEELSKKMEVFRGSRMQREQSDRIVESMREVLAVTEGRMEQARSDDRFGGRQHWRALQQSMKTR